jgi:hypothetical protein
MRTMKVDKSKEEQIGQRANETAIPRRRWTLKTCRRCLMLIQKPDDLTEYAIREHQRRKKELSTNYTMPTTESGAGPACVDVASPRRTGDSRRTLTIPTAFRPYTSTTASWARRTMTSRRRQIRRAPGKSRRRC